MPRLSHFRPGLPGTAPPVPETLPADPSPAEPDGPEDVTTTRRGVPKRPAEAPGRGACLVHIYPRGPGMGQRFALAADPLVIGRHDGCAVRLCDTSVSRQHLRVEPRPDGIYAVDLGSTNGSFVNDVPVGAVRLNDGDYLRVGNCIFRYLAGGNVEAEYHEEIYRMAIIDALTGAHNRRYLEEFLDRELARSERHGRPLALVLFDIDRFKGLNDRLGHLGGDHTLRELAGLVRGQVRKADLLARYGGEEFAIVLPETPRAGAAGYAERLRRRVEAHPFVYAGEPYAVTISLGVAATEGGVVLAPEAFIGQADARLYEAKNQGRNRVVA